MPPYRALCFDPQFCPAPIPQLIVMREAVPDAVAQIFLKHFLALFSQGKSFYLAVREARERLQGLEDQFPCASWLPVICQNPTVTPPTWDQLASATSLSSTTSRSSAPQQAQTVTNRLKDRPMGTRKDGASITEGSDRSTQSKTVSQLATSIQPQARRTSLHPLQFLAQFSAVVTVLLIGLRWFGWLQPMELWVFDQFIQWQPSPGVDERILVVKVTEADIQRQAQYPLSDAVLLKTVQILKSYNPRVIGLDIYRDIPVEPGYERWATHLQNDPALISICEVGLPESNNPDNIGVPSPPASLPENRSFSDVSVDSDGVVRRQLFHLDVGGGVCQANYSLG